MTEKSARVKIIKEIKMGAREQERTEIWVGKKIRKERGIAGPMSEKGRIDSGVKTYLTVKMAGIKKMTHPTIVKQSYANHV